MKEGEFIKEKLLVLLLISSTCLSGCNIVKEKPKQNEQQLQCEHEYTEIAWHAVMASDGSGVTYDIYCPKCQWETTVSSKEWKRIQANMSYKDKDN